METLKLEIKIAMRMLSDKFWTFLAWRLPRKLIMWSSIRLIAHATQGEYGNTIVPELSAMDALQRWG